MLAEVELVSRTPQPFMGHPQLPLAPLLSMEPQPPLCLHMAVIPYLPMATEDQPQM